MVALSSLEGPALPGLPADELGFTFIDDRGRVEGLQDVYAVGDGTSFAIKQGGIAAQQADLVAEDIASRSGASFSRLGSGSRRFAARCSPGSARSTCARGWGPRAAPPRSRRSPPGGLRGRSRAAISLPIWREATPARRALRRPPSRASTAARRSRVGWRERESDRFSAEQARQIGAEVGIDWAEAPFDVEEFRNGMHVELEHGRHDPRTNVTDDDAHVTAKIALAHLNEFPDYYTRLARMEREAEAYWAERAG